MYEILCANSSIGSRFLSFFMASKYSHSAVWDATTNMVTHSTLLGGGVRELTKEEFDLHYPKRSAPKLMVNADKQDEARLWLKQQVNKPYDWQPLFSIALQWFIKRSWQQDNAWFCSELTETVRSKFGTARFSSEAGWITPKHQSMVI